MPALTTVEKVLRRDAEGDHPTILAPEEAAALVAELDRLRAIEVAARTVADDAEYPGDDPDSPTCEIDRGTLEALDAALGAT